MASTAMSLLQWLRKQLKEADADLLKRGGEEDGTVAHRRRGVLHLQGGIKGERRPGSSLDI